MKLPSHVLTKLFVAGAVGTVGAVVLLHPMRPEPECTPCEAVVEAVPTEIDESESLLEIVRQNHDFAPLVAPLPPPPPVHTPQPQPQFKPKPKPRHFASSCGGLVPIDPTKGPVMLKACGKG